MKKFIPMQIKSFLHFMNFHQRKFVNFFLSRKVVNVPGIVGIGYCTLNSFVISHSLVIIALLN